MPDSRNASLSWLMFFLACLWMNGFTVIAQTKGDLVLSIGLGYRSDESPVERLFTKPPNNLYDANDGTLKGWMGGWVTDLSLQKAFFKRTLTGFTVRASYHNIRNEFFIYPNYLLFHDWYYRQKHIANRWLFGFQITNNKTRVYSSGEPIFPGGPIFSGFEYRSWGLGARGGRLLAQNGFMKDTYLRAELTYVFARKEFYPPYPGIQIGLSLYKHILLNSRAVMKGASSEP